MKKLIFCCLVVLMGSCKDKNDDPEPEVDYAPEYVGSYGTLVVDGPTSVQNDWVITATGKNQLKIVYTRNIHVEIAGAEVDVVQEYNLVDVKSTKDSFTINETVDVIQSTGKPLRHLVTGLATKVAGASGEPQLNTNIKLADPSNGKSSYEGYLEFKKK
ncbi:hypothetical protein [Dyadobacter psychrophilus]|uniref:Lipocalin-like domain-containing protein n=1 Tax=Dyadobacter psychrophilus TaxID=651661 RepID=A0A1T5B976_9BACT|nr:hypothetical protein [Dyadobacter psychrophilus]SKB43818.1 hypothetical protein SAMN05660293_00158 [Dyadobacter psychrophilus]